MKKGFGWFFCILGGLNIFRGFIMLSEGMGGGILIFGIGFIVLGIWMINTSKPKEDKSQMSSKIESNREYEKPLYNGNNNNITQKDASDKQSKPEKETNSFYDLEESILLMKDFISQMDKGFSKEIGEELLGMFAELLKKLRNNLDAKELNKAIECLNLIENFEIDSATRENIKTMKANLMELAQIASARVKNINRINDFMNNPKKESQPKNLYEQVLPLSNQILVNGYRRIARQRNVTPTLKTSDEKIIEIYKQVGTAFNEAAKQRSEHIPAVYLNFIVLKFFQVYEMGGDMLLNEHLQYEVGKYLSEGLRQEYKQELKLV